MTEPQRLFLQAQQDLISRSAECVERLVADYGVTMVTPEDGWIDRKLNYAQPPNYATMLRPTKEGDHIAIGSASLGDPVVIGRFRIVRVTRVVLGSFSPRYYFEEVVPEFNLSARLLTSAESVASAATEGLGCPIPAFILAIIGVALIGIIGFQLAAYGGGAPALYNADGSVMAYTRPLREMQAMFGLGWACFAAAAIWALLDRRMKR